MKKTTKLEEINCAIFQIPDTQKIFGGQNSCPYADSSSSTEVPNNAPHGEKVYQEDWDHNNEIVAWGDLIIFSKNAFGKKIRL